MKKLTVAFMLIFTAAALSAKENSGYLILGQNSIQKVYYRTSSNLAPANSGKMALDGNSETAWISAADEKDHWLEIDFPNKRLMSTIVVTTGRKDKTPTVKNFVLQFYFMDKWFDFARIDCEKDEKGRKKFRETVSINLGGVDASRFRILIPEGSTFGNFASISEVETYVGSGKIRYFDNRLKQLTFPVKNGLLPENDEGYPNAPRAYRGGRHVGLDVNYYHEDDSFDPKPVTKSTPIIASGDGVILRADWNYVPLTPEQWKAQSAYYQKNSHTFDARSFGGRQIWIDHGNGVVTTYNHLSAISKKITVGTKVKKGAIIGYAGNSGLLGDSEGKDYGVHLHYEIWIDSYFLGNGMTTEEIKNYLRWIFFSP